MNRHDFNNVLAALIHVEQEALATKLDIQKGVYVFPEHYRPAIAVRPLYNLEYNKTPHIVSVEKIELMEPYPGESAIIITATSAKGAVEHIDIDEVYPTEASRLCSLIPEHYVDNETILAFWKAADGNWSIPKNEDSGYNGLPDHDGEKVFIDEKTHTINVTLNDKKYHTIEDQEAWDDMIKIKALHDKGLSIHDAVIEFYKTQNFDLPF